MNIIVTGSNCAFRRFVCGRANVCYQAGCVQSRLFLFFIESAGVVSVPAFRSGRGFESRWVLTYQKFYVAKNAKRHWDNPLRQAIVRISIEAMSYNLPLQNTTKIITLAIDHKTAKSQEIVMEITGNPAIQKDLNHRYTSLEGGIQI